MDPEIQDLLRQVQEARARGRNLQEINTRLQKATNGRYPSVTALRAASTTVRQDASAAPGPAPDSERGAFAGIGRVGRLAGDVFAFGGLDEGAALLAGLGAAVVPGGKGFSEAREAELRASRERLRKAEEEAGPGTKAVGFGLGLLGPGGVLRAGTRGAKAARAGVPAVRGAATGAAEGGAFGLLGADPDPDLPLAENLEERAGESVVPTILGGATGGAVGTAFAGRAASKAKPTAGARLGEAARRESGLSGKASRVTRDVAERKREISRTQFKPLEELGEIDSPVIRGALEADDVKPIVSDLFPDVAEGRNPTFLELQKIKKRLEGLRDRAVRSGDSFEVDKFGRATEEVTEAIEESVEGFPEARRAWALESQRIRALEDGRSAMRSGTADDVEEAFRSLPDDPEVKDAFREGLAAEFVARVEKLSEPKAVLRQIQNSPQLRNKLRVLFGSDDALKRFTNEALGEERLRNRAQFYERVRRWAGLIAASSAVGNEVAGGILGN